MIQDQVAAGAPILATPKCAASATAYRTSEIIQTTIVGALPEFFMSLLVIVGMERQAAICLRSLGQIGVYADSLGPDT